MATAKSLHIGLNHVDPNGYGGWDGQLEACVNDATSMEKLAKAAGFDTSTLFDEDATASGVVGALGTVASELVAGDIFLLTYAGHGGQLDDLNGDEADSKDETWCLYDRELLDDEIYQALSGFAVGVRIVVLSDSCHSGTVLRDLYVKTTDDVPEIARHYDRMASPLTTKLRSRAAKILRFRSVPDDVQVKILERDRPMYERIRTATAKRDEVTVAASALLISGCQDNQTSAEQNGHGAFTAALLQVWGEEGENGFSGDYHELHHQVAAKLPPTQSPNFFTVGASRPEFEAQVPFTIAAPNASTSGTSDSSTDTTGTTSTGDTSGTSNGSTDTSSTTTDSTTDTASTNGSSSASTSGASGSTSSTPAVSSGPSIKPPASVCRSDSAPSCAVVKGTNAYYIVEISADPALFGSTDGRDDAGRWYASWNDPDAPARYCEDVYWIPTAAWENLKGNDKLYFRIGTTSSETDWSDYAVSTQDDCGSDAPSMAIVGADDRAMSRELVYS